MKLKPGAQKRYEERINNRTKHGLSLKISTPFPKKQPAYIHTPKPKKVLAGFKIFSSVQSLKLGRT